MYDFDWSSIPGALPFLWQGMKISLAITAIAIAAGIAWGTALAVMRLSPAQSLSLFAAGYVSLFRSVPLVMVLLWFFLIVPQLLRDVLHLSHATDLRLASKRSQPKLRTRTSALAALNNSVQCSASFWAKPSGA